MYATLLGFDSSWTSSLTSCKNSPFSKKVPEKFCIQCKVRHVSGIKSDWLVLVARTIVVKFVICLLLHLLRINTLLIIHLLLLIIIIGCISPRKQKASKNQQGNQRGIPDRNIQESSIPRKIQVGTKRKIIIRFQRENFAPTKFKIKIRV